MNLPILPALALFALAGCGDVDPVGPSHATSATADGWMTDAAAARALAGKTGKVVLMDFTGSDWCGWCIKLKEEVFSTPEFATWAKGKAVLLEVDFPRSKELSAAEKAANKDLAETYKIEGFPSVVITDAAGKELGRLGYQEGGPKAWIAAADAIIPAR